MAQLVPIVAGSSRKLDKISILRLAAAFLRTQYILGRGSNFLPRQFNEFDLEQYFVDHIVDSGGFFLVVTTAGKIVYVSRQVEQHLGHVQNELLGQSLFNFVYPEDHGELSRNLKPDGMQSTTAPSPTGVAQVSDLVHDNNSSSSEDSTTNHNRTNEKNKPLFHEQRRNFKIRMAQRTVSRREHTQYESFDISGVLRLAEACKNADTNGNRGRHRETTGNNDIVFAGVATLPKKRPITELSIMDANKDEYVTRHLVDGRIIYCDHRVSVVAGYMSEEVSGLNAFAFMHKDDFRWTMIGLRQMYDRAETCGSSCYRLLTKTGEFIYLRTHGYLEYDKDTQTVESFVCVNTLVSEDEGIQLIKEMKGRFSATVSVASKNLIKNVDVTSTIELDSSSQSSNPRCSLEDPSQLEDAITHLISDLPSPAVSEERFSPSPMQHTQYVKAAIFSSRMPPAAAQANKIGINKIDRYVVIQGKGNRIPKQESKEQEHSIGKFINSSSAEQSPISDSESAKSSGKPLSMLDMMNGAHNNHNNVQNDVSVQSNILANTRNPNTNRCRSVSRNRTSCLDMSQNANGHERIEQRNNILSPGALHENNIKLERGIETFNQKQELYFDDSTSDSSVVSQGIETHNRCTLKRICSDEDLPTMHSKKRSNDVYVSTNANDEQQRVSYVNCGTFATENKYPAVEFNRYNDANLQPLITAESPNSSLEHEIGKKYQQLIDPPASLVITNSDEVQFDLRDMKDDNLLNSDLTANPELMMKIFNGLHNGPVTGFENRFNETKLQQLASSHHTVNDELRRTYRQIASNITLQQSQINMLTNDFENPILHSQRENLSQLQVEHNMQKQMLKTLQQDHHKMQVNAKHNLGI
ncbi:neuronal pas domain-containing protein 2 [Lasius niger]|uniref:Neuronal pas domain-containing protein 2 n=2 Tax=Lasius TaxID=488720 RepID=A0A0J7L0Q2_LASNI|nr:neuronal pas domain-containing protein 2 [Lasius niger]